MPQNGGSPETKINSQGKTSADDSKASNPGAASKHAHERGNFETMMPSGKSLPSTPPDNAKKALVGAHLAPPAEQMSRDQLAPILRGSATETKASNRVTDRGLASRGDGEPELSEPAPIDDHSKASRSYVFPTGESEHRA